ncbi:MAG: glycoside hydrolase family 3 N-terminal domain-containing protein [Flavobacteriaceae bacterium]|nr:glycoside hydrolase family 3 N-terminal domain-containing protein [Flavobacteriaceae bacterium]
MRYIYILFFIPIFSFSQSIDPLLVKNHSDQKNWVDSVYSKISLEEKIGQLFVVWASPSRGEKHFKEIKRQIKNHKIGGIIFSLGGPKSHVKWLNSFQTLSKIPLMISMDAEWGVAMRLDSIMPFPWNMTLGAIQDNKLIEEIGYRIGEQAKRLGIHINYSPVVDINTNPENPIIGNRSFGENRINVSRKGIAMINGLSRSGTLSSAKHFPGHGDTSQDSHKVLPKITFSRKRIDSIELYPFKKLIKKGLSSIMIAHLNIPSLDNNVPSSMSKKIVTKILKEDLDFKGLIFTDALDMKGATDFSESGNIDLLALLAGNDVLLMSNDISKGIRAIKKAYNLKILTEERLSYSVKKILKAKYKVGLNDFNLISKDNLLEDLNLDSDKKLYSKAISNAITVLKNDDDIIPISNKKKYGLLILGDTSSIEFYDYLSKNNNVSLIDSEKSIDKINEEINGYEATIISFHRSNNNPFKSDKLSNNQVNIINGLAKNHRVILNVFDNPYSLENSIDLKLLKGLVISYQNTQITQLESASILLGERGAIGKLPVSVGESFQTGDGLKTFSKNTLRYSSPYSVGMSNNKLDEIDQLIEVAIDSMMIPGAQVLISRKGKIFYHKAFGFHTYKKRIPVKTNDLYDLASLTKILATLPLIIQEVDREEFSLEDKLGDLFPQWKYTNKRDIVVKDLLTHYAKLIPWIPFYLETKRKGSGKLKRKIYKKRSSNKYANKVAEKIFIKNNYKDRIIKEIFESKLRDTLEMKYSDFPFIILQSYLEEKYNKSLSSLVDERIYRPLNLKKTFFNPLTKKEVNLNQIVPSEKDEYFRNQELKGYVHDMAAAMLGGVAGHAGLFSNAKDIAVIMQMYLNKGFYNGHRFFRSKTFDEFNNCLYCDFKNRRGVGFDKPQIEGDGITCGCVPKSSFGHSGFTGTYTWSDPENEIVYVFLSNRTFPTMENSLLIDHSIRTRIQKIIYDAIIK